MPNWCANGLQIIATDDEQKEKLKELSEHIKNDGGLCSFFHPCPQDLLDTVAGYMSGEEGEKLKLQEEANLEKHGSKNWYDWQISNWGTKWDPSVMNDSFTYDDDCFECFFDSAWNPPIEFYNKLVEEGYKVTATYNEGGCDYIGWYDDGDDNCLSWSEIRDEYEEQFTQLQDSPKPENEDSDERWEWNSMLTEFSQEKFFEDQGLSELTPNGWGG
jgi:hypothetical protein